jgi:hypothetical protein
LKSGAVLAAKAAKGTKIEIFGYAEPVHTVDDGLVVATQSAQPLDSLLGLPEASTLS